MTGQSSIRVGDDRGVCGKERAESADAARIFSHRIGHELSYLLWKDEVWSLSSLLAWAAIDVEGRGFLIACKKASD